MLVLAVKVVAAAAQSAFQSVPWVLRTTKVLLQGKAATASAAAGAGDPPSYYQILEWNLKNAILHNNTSPNMFIMHHMDGKKCYI